MDTDRLVLTIPHPRPEPLKTGHLAMGGSNPDGVEISVTNRHLTLGGRPFLPVMGEFHYARNDSRFWKEELLKMKAGGIQIVASYVFWIHHEEIEGVFDWSGNRDLRRFITLCGELGLYAFPRIGPWCHGECRNGGHPEWIEKGEMERRTTDPRYFEPVRRFYRQIGRQLRGLFWKDGGPVIGVQLDNEYYLRGPGRGGGVLSRAEKSRH